MGIDSLDFRKDSATEKCFDPESTGDFHYTGSVEFNIAGHDSILHGEKELLGEISVRGIPAKPKSCYNSRYSNIRFSPYRRLHPSRLEIFPISPQACDQI
jgi:hypothetical protein